MLFHGFHKYIQTHQPKYHYIVLIYEDMNIERKIVWGGNLIVHSL